MRIKFQDSEIECDASEMETALNAIERLASISGNRAPRVINGASVLSDKSMAERQYNAKIGKLKPSFEEKARIGQPISETDETICTKEHIAIERLKAAGKYDENWTDETEAETVSAPTQSTEGASEY